jgi:hypothetical protein
VPSTARQVTVTAWDRRVFLRAFVASITLFVGVWLVTAATDEGSIGWGARAGRALPLVPLCAAAGAWMGLAAARARGEARALQALGRSPSEVGLPAVAGASAFVVLAALALASVPAVGVEGFYPSVPTARAFVLDGDALLDESGALRVTLDGVPERVDPPRPPRHLGSTPRVAVPPHGRAAAGLAMLLAGLALPLLAAGTRARHAPRAVAWVGLGMAGALVLFQAAAASRLWVGWAVVPPMALLFGALRIYRSAS